MCIASSSAARGRRRRRLQVVLAALGREHRPEVAGALAASAPRVAVGRAVAVAVAVVAVPARPARRGRHDGRVDDGQRLQDVGVVGRQLAEPGQLQEARRRSRARWSSVGPPLPTL